MKHPVEYSNSKDIMGQQNEDDETPIKEELSVFNQDSADSVMKENETPCFNKPTMRILGNHGSMMSNFAASGKATSSFEDIFKSNTLEEQSVDTATTSLRQLVKQHTATASPCQQSQLSLSSLPQSAIDAFFD